MIVAKVTSVSTSGASSTGRSTPGGSVTGGIADGISAGGIVVFEVGTSGVELDNFGERLHAAAMHTGACKFDISESRSFERAHDSDAFGG
jgi:hypothetical protein